MNIVRNLRVIPQDRTIFNGNTYMGYIDEDDDVYVISQGFAKWIGNSSSFAEALDLVNRWMDGKLS